MTCAPTSSTKASDIQYDHLLSTLSKEQWKRIGVQRRSGVVAPLFSIYSSKSSGIGEVPDLMLLVDWCKATGMSIIQLLPVNDVGFNFRPYDAQSTFALDPMYLSLLDLSGINITPFKKEIKKIKSSFPTGSNRVNYQVKRAKLDLLLKIFKKGGTVNNPPFEAYVQDNHFWLEDYALFKVIKAQNHEASWETWSATAASFRETYRQELTFQKWLQWQLFEQFRKVKAYAQKMGVLIMGDLPFLVSRDSADVWSHQEYFKLGFSAGAPPDMLYSNGQRWGMPPYDWESIAVHGHDYLIEKLRYARNFYDLYRIDHVVGIFRVWSIPLSQPIEHSGLHGVFDPKDEHAWEEHGRRLLSVMIKNSDMLACAEDLGTVPVCSFKVLEELGIPGIEVQRWKRDWGKSYDFKAPEGYRKNSLATIATHDMSSLGGWWKFEAGTIDEGLFKRKCFEKNISFESLKPRLFDLEKSFHGRFLWKKEVASPAVLLGILGLQEPQAKDILDFYKGSYDEKQKFLSFLGIEQMPEDEFSSLFVKRVLEKVNAGASIFSIQLLHDWLSLDTLFDFDPWGLRINFPGTISDKNWTLAIGLSLEDMLTLPVNSVIKSINEQAGRV